MPKTWRRPVPSWHAACLALSCAVAVPAQEAVVTTTGGEHLRGVVVGCEPGVGGLLRIAVDGADVPSSIPLRDVLAVHGVTPVRFGSVEVRLVGGETLNGELLAGDADGERFGLRSASLGQLAVPIDRLDVMMFRERAADAGPEAFTIPADADADEALFRRAARVGFSRVLGGIHRFRRESVLFGVGERDPEPFRYDDLVAIALRGGIEREAPAEALLLTRSGDVVGVDILGFEDGRFRFSLEIAEREFELGMGDIASLTFLGFGRRFLSDLEPEAVEERAYFDEVPLLPHRRDRSVSGEHLVSGRIAHAKGLGVHSRSVLRYRVPEGVTTFHASVGLCDEVRALGMRAEASVRVERDGAVVWQRERLTIKDGAIPLQPIDVKPGQEIALCVEFGAALDLGDRVGWLGALFY